MQLLYNIIHKLGNIYDCIYFLVKHHKASPFKILDENGEKVDRIMPSLEDIPEDDIEAIATAEATIEEYEKDKEE